MSLGLHPPPPPNVGGTWICFPRPEYGKGKTITLQWGNLADMLCNLSDQVTVTREKSCGHQESPGVMGRALLLRCHLAPKSIVKVTQSCLTLCDPMDYTVLGILQARILEWVAFAFSRGFSQPRDRTQISCIAGGFFTS